MVPRKYLNLEFNEKWEISKKGLINDINSIKRRKFTIDQKIHICNLLFIPRLRFAFQFVCFPENLIVDMQTLINKTITRSGYLSQSTRLCASLMDGWNINNGKL